jgi:nitroreductase
VDLPGPDADNPIAREPLWHAFGAGQDEPEPPPWTWVSEPPPETHVPPPPPASVPDGKHVELPFGTVDLLSRLPFPAGRATGMSDVDASLGAVLVTALGVQRHEPDNPFNSHRPYASPRCLFPVSVFAGDGERWRLLDVARHALLELADARGDAPNGLVLTGQYTRIPRAYKWFRGSLVNLELGIVLRSLGIAAELFAWPARLRLPSNRTGLLGDLGLSPSWAWSLPLSIEFDESGFTATHGEQDRDQPSDAALADLVRVNRAQDFTEPPAELGPAIPRHTTPMSRPVSWAEVMWRRGSGRMPRGLHGMSGYRRRVPASALTDALAWLAVVPPGPVLRAAYHAVTSTVVLQDVERHADGVYRALGGAVLPHAEDATAAKRLEAAYGYPLTPGNGCAIRHASMIWFFSVRPRQLMAAFGEGGWSAAQYACGWAAHGLCLAAAAAGLFARPVRAFHEIPAQRILRLDSDEMIVLAVVVGHQRPTAGPVLDLRL